jgi:RimJ/RimL family protein N-acetyltransferase
MNLTSIYARPDRALVLYRLLEEREPEHNISHKAMPSWDEHVRFVESRPYQAWYFIIDGDDILGACYLSKQDEIGVFVGKPHRGKGHGPWAIQAIMLRHGNRRYLANISPKNTKSAEIFRNMGFRHIQDTFERRDG